MKLGQREGQISSSVLSTFLGKEDLEVVLLIPAQSVTQQAFLLWNMPDKFVLVPI